MGVDYLIEFPLTEYTAKMDPEMFVKDILLDKMNTSFIVAGSDVSFGDRGRGDGKLLREMGQMLSFEVMTIDKLTMEGIEISSTYVRGQVEQGNMEFVSTLLGNPYTIVGEVVYGKQLGRTLGIPTINVIPKVNKLLPPNGVSPFPLGKCR